MKPIQFLTRMFEQQTRRFARTLHSAPVVLPRCTARRLARPVTIPVRHQAARACGVKIIQVAQRAVVAMACLLAASAQAGTHVWSGVALGNKNWSSPVNWSAGGVPTAAEAAPVVLVFPNGSALESTNNIAGLTVDRLQFNGPGFTVQGANGVALTLRGGSSVTNIVSSGAGQNTLASSLDLVLSGDCVVKSDAGTLAIAGVVSGSGGLTKDGAGTLMFSGSQVNSYTGETWVIDGTLLLSRQFLIIGSGFVGRVSVPGALFISYGTVQLGADDNIADLAPITINSSGELDLDGHNDTVGALTLNGGDIATGTGLLTLNGNVSANAAPNASSITGQLSLGDTSRSFSVADNAVLTISADISSSGIGLPGFGKTGNGLLQLFGANTFAGSVSVNAGELVAGHFSALGSTFRGTSLAPGAVLRLMNNASIGAEALTVNGGTLVSVGTNSWAGDITLNATLVTTNTASDGELILHGVMAGAGGLTHRGNGKLRLGGSTENTFTGATTLVAGVLELDKSGVATAIPGALVVGDGLGGNYSDLVHFRRSDQISDGSTVTVNSSGKLDLDGQSDSIGALTLNGGGIFTGAGILTLGGNVSVTANAAMFGKLSLGTATRFFDVADGALLTLSAVLQPTASNVSFIKTGAGLLGLYGANQHGGATVVNGGELLIGHVSALGSVFSGTAVNSGGRLNVSGGRTITGEPLTLNSGAFYTRDETNVWTGTVTLLGTNSIVVDLTGAQLEFSGLMSGPGGWIKGGLGTLFLSGTGPNTYTGESWITNGTLALQKVYSDAQGIHGTTAVPGPLRAGNGWDYGIPTFVRELQDHQLSDNSIVVLHKDATLDLDDNSDTVGSLELRGGVIETGTGLLTLNGDVRSPGYADESTIRGRLHLGSQPREFYADVTTEVIIEARISGPASASVTKTGSGRFSLSGSNSFAGPTVISGGWLEVRHSNALGGTDNGTEVNGYGGLQLAHGVHVQGESLAIQGSGGSGYGALLVANNAQAIWSGAVSLTADTTMQALGANARLALNGPITGSGNLLLNAWGTGTVVFGGAQDNLFNGTTEIRTGNLLLEKIAGFTAVPGPLTCGRTNVAEDTLVQLLHANQIANHVPVTVNKSARLDLNDFSDAIGELHFFGGIVDTGNGTLTLGGNVTAEQSSGFVFGKVSLGGVTRTFDVSGLHSLNFDATLSDGGANAGVIKTGTGLLNLGGSNSFSGLMHVQAGTLYVNHPFALGETTAGTIVSGVAEMVVQGGNWTFGAEALTLESTNSGTGALKLYDNITWVGPITLANNVGVWVDTAAGQHTFTVLGPINGSGGFVLGGGGKMVLGGNAANTFAGPLHVASGSLDLNKNNGAVAVSGPLHVGVDWHAAGHEVVRLLQANQISDDVAVMLDVSGTLNLDGHNDVIGSLSGSGQMLLGSAALYAGRDNTATEFSGLLAGNGTPALVKQGTGKMILSGMNSLTYLGQTLVNSGALIVNGFIAAPVTVGSGATLGGSGAVGNITLAGGTLSPGNSPGALQSQSVQFNAGATFRAELNGPTPGIGYDTVNVSGAVNLGNAALDASLGYAGTVGQQFMLFNNDGNEPVTGTFAGFAEGAHMFLNGAEFALSYHGGSGSNDVVLTQLSISPNFATLAIERLAAQQVRLSWSTNAVGFQAQTASSLPAGGWQPVSGAPVVAGDKFTLTLPATNSAAFFRLVKP